MTSPKFDTTINLGHIISIVMFLAVGIATWYSFQNRLAAAEYRLDQVEKANIERDAIRDRVTKELKESIKDSNNDVKQEIRDLRNDLLRPNGLGRR